MEAFQVIIAGAGPAGAVAAYTLAQRGVDVLLLESHSFPPEDMRASTFHAATLDMMEDLDLLDVLEEQGLRAPIYQYRNRRSGEILEFDLGELSDVVKHPYRLQCEQYKLSREVTKRLASHSHGQVRFQSRVVSFEQSDTDVVVHVETPFKMEVYKADYLIAADGANSIIRKWLNVNFEGFTYPEKFLTLSTAAPLENYFENLAQVNYMADETEWCVMLRVPELWRILVPALEANEDEILLSDAKKNTVFDGLMGDGQSIQTYHRTIYRVHQRVAEKYNHNRVILIGDSAHLNNPLGGLGMNSGIHDAVNLADKLVSILKEGKGAEPLLDKYDRQRRTVMNEFVQSQTIRNKKAMESPSAQRDFQQDMEATLQDDQRRRAYLLNSSMVSSLKREAEIE